MSNVSITYISHSGFMVETETAVLLFDYFKGALPPVNLTKSLVVFVSHVHHDHYNKAIWNLYKNHPDTTYVLSYDIPLHRQPGLPALSPGGNLAVCSAQPAGTEYFISGTNKKARVFSLRPDVSLDLQLKNRHLLRIETFTSTDEGLAFFIECGGLTIYHAGDLHLWLWEENGQAYMDEMRSFFNKSVSGLKNRHADIAFLPLDNRLKTTAFAGMDAYLKLMDITYAFPMHMWDDYALTNKYLNERRSLKEAKALRKISHEGECFTLNINAEDKNEQI